MYISKEDYRFGSWYCRAALVTLVGMGLIFAGGCLPRNYGVTNAQNREFNPTPPTVSVSPNTTFSTLVDLPVSVIADSDTRKPVCPNQLNNQLPQTHVTLNCTDCHGDTAVIAQLKVSPQNCNACHQKDDKHAGTNGQNCAMCHNTSDWTWVSVDHSYTAFRLTGKHAKVDCADCHVNKVFTGTFTTCYPCHRSKNTH